MEKIKQRILLVEDDREIHHMLSVFLEQNGYEVDSAYQGREAGEKLKSREYDLILMDLMLPYQSGDLLIRDLRSTKDTPVIVLSAKSMTRTRVEVLRMGADDYILKPFDFDEVLARMEAVLRRRNTGNEKRTFLHCGSLLLNEETRQVFVKEAEIGLTAKEYEILRLLMKNPHKTFTKANLFESVWQEAYCGEENSVNVHLSNLRSKLKKAGNGKDYIETVWGIGYRLKNFCEKN